MTRVKGKLVEQAVNKFIEMVLSRLVNAERLQVRLEANLKDLLAGKLDALTIEMFGFLLRRHLRVAEFQFDIGASAVNLESVMRRQIQLLHPSEGSVRMVITQSQLTAFLNAELPSLCQIQQSEFLLKQINCELREDDAIAFYFHWTIGEENHSETYITMPQIETNTNQVMLVIRDIEEKELPSKIVNATLARVNEIFNLTDIADRGSTFLNQKVNIEGDKITVQANAYIEQLPSN